MEFIGYITALLIGLSLGLIGGGGSLLTVPVLVYLFGIDAVLATGYSLFIVGITSLVGGARAFAHKLVDFRAVSLFGIPSILTIFMARHFVLPAIPEYIFSVGDMVINKGRLLMLVFAVVMVVSAFFMLRSNNKAKELLNEEKDLSHHYKLLSLLVPGLIVGLFTGLLGAGGGFLIVPALVLLIRLPMKTAIGTSLLIIAINSLFGFVFSIGHYHFNWSLLLSFTGIAVIGVFIGSLLSKKIEGAILKMIFGWFVLLMGLFILMNELFLRA
ncbi:MAG: sulfite exporter TauE/SafE family protein [Chitinophagaceae bacterium]